MDDFDNKLAEAFCSHLLRCCDESQLTAIGKPTELDACVDDVWMTFGFMLMEHENGVESGKILYDQEKAGEVVAAVKQAPCEGSDHLGPMVGSAFQADREAGESCSTIFSCKGGKCLGEVCEAARIQGESCRLSTDCDDGLFCDSGGSQCASLLGENEPCAVLQCQEGLYCDQVCVKKKGLDQSCESSLSCDSGLICAEQTSMCIAVCAQLL